MANSFGKRTTPNTPAGETTFPKNTGGGNGAGGDGTGGGGPTQREVEFPWVGKADETACNFALGHLVRNLPEQLTDQRGVHAETLLTAAGAIAGYATQYALVNGTSDAGIADDDGFMCVETANGDKFIFGEPLNQKLISTSDEEANGCLWPLAAGAAVTNGLAIDKIPPVESMFAHVSATIGSENEGLPSITTEHHPGAPAKTLLNHTWPLALACFSGTLSDITRQIGSTEIGHWPAIAAHTAGSLVRQTKDVLAPALALTLVMESAIYASKLHPSVVTNGNSG